MGFLLSTDHDFVKRGRKIPLTDHKQIGSFTQVGNRDLELLQIRIQLLASNGFPKHIADLQGGGGVSGLGERQRDEA